MSLTRRLLVIFYLPRESETTSIDDGDKLCAA